MRDLLTFCEHHLDDMVSAIERLAALESPSTDKSAVDRCGAELAKTLRDAGAAVESLPRADRGDHIRAEWPGAGAPVLLLGHFDTVWAAGTLAHMPVRREGGRLFGPGVFDMKAGIALAITAVGALNERGTPRPPIRMLWTTDEEIGSGTSRQEVETNARGCRAVLVLEPALPGGALKTARKGCGEYELLVDGVAAHAGLDPGKGVSAIHELADQIREIEALADRPDGVTLNVGIVDGGTRANVIAAHARAVIDARALRGADANRVDSALRSLRPKRSGARLTVRGGFERPPLERTPDVVRLFDIARGVARELGRPLDEGTAGGGSDGNFTAAAGVPTLDGLGAIGDGAHASHEHVVIDELPWRAALLAGLLTRL